MTDPNMPSGSSQAHNYLLGEKSRLMKVAELIVNNELTTFSQINGYIWSEIEKLDELIEDGA